MSDVSIRTLLLEFVDSNGASHIRQMHIEVLRRKPDTPEHTIRARLSEAVSDGVLDRLGDGFYDIYAEDEGMTSVVSYPRRSSQWGSSRYRGNCDGRLIKDLILRYGVRKVADPMQGSGTTRDVVVGLNRYKHVGISYWGGDIREGFDLTRHDLPGQFDFIWIHPPYWNIIQYGSNSGDLSNCESHERFRELLMVCLKRCYEALEVGGRLAVLIGDVRRKGRHQWFAATEKCCDRVYRLFNEISSSLKGNPMNNNRTTACCPPDSRLHTHQLLQLINNIKPKGRPNENLVHKNKWRICRVYRPRSMYDHWRVLLWVHAEL